MTKVWNSDGTELIEVILDPGEQLWLMKQNIKLLKEATALKNYGKTKKGKR